MKKLLLVLISITLMFGLGACSPSQTEFEELESRIEELETRTDLIENILINLGVMVGLNGIAIPYYADPQVNELAMLPKETLLVRLNAMETEDLIILKDTLDRIKAPPYILDDNEEYVELVTLGMLLKAKYFDSVEHIEDRYESIVQLKFVYLLEDPSYDLNELLARASLLIFELREYAHWYLNSTQVVLDLYYNSGGYTSHIVISIPMRNMANEYISLTVDGIYDEDYEISLIWNATVNIDKIAVQQYYDDFITNETFTGYVLNFTK